MKNCNVYIAVILILAEIKTIIAMNTLQKEKAGYFYPALTHALPEKQLHGEGSLFVRCFEHPSPLGYEAGF